MNDRDLVDGCAQQWDPDQQGPPAWMAWSLVAVLASAVGALLLVAVAGYRMIGAA